MSIDTTAFVPSSGVKLELNVTELRLVGEGAGSSRILQLRGPMMMKGRYRPPTMTLANFEKDLCAVLEKMAGI